MRTITFYSYKGGTGRSLALANTAYFLAWLGRKVFVVDLDLEAPGLHYKFQLQQPEPGLVDLWASIVSTREIPELKPFVHAVPRRNRIDGHIDLLPAGAAPRPPYPTTLKNLELPMFFEAQCRPDAFVVEGLEKHIPAALPLFLEIKKRIREDYEPDYLLIDSRTGITEIGGAALRWMPDTVVCLTQTGNENEDGCRTVLQDVARARRLSDSVPDNKPIDVVLALTRIREISSKETDKQLADLQKRFREPLESTEETPEAMTHVAPTIVAAVPLHDDMALDRGEFIVFTSSTANESVVLRDYHRLFRDLGFYKDYPDKPVPEGHEQITRFLAGADRIPDVKTALLRRRKESGADGHDPYDVLERVRGRDLRQLRYVEAMYSKQLEDEAGSGNKSAQRGYTAFIEVVHAELLDEANQKEANQKDANVEWGVATNDTDFDLLAFHLRDGTTDFCDELYYLTEFRRRLVDVVQLGTCPYFEVWAGGKLRGSPGLDPDAVNPSHAFANYFRDLIAKYPQDAQKDALRVIVRGDTPAAIEASRRLGAFLTTQSVGRDDELWRELQTPGPVAAVVDTIIIEALSRKHTNGACSRVGTIEYSPPIPVGLAYPREDLRWRRKIAKAVGDALLANNATMSKRWPTVQGQVLDSSGVELFDLRLLFQLLLLDTGMQEVLQRKQEFEQVTGPLFG